MTRTGATTPKSAPSVATPLEPAPSIPAPVPDHMLVSVNLMATVEAAAQARTVVTDLLEQGRRPEMVDTACLLTSELVANAVVHAGAPVALVVDLDRARLAVEVIDGSPSDPTPTDAAPLDTNGRGLALVDKLADSWGVSRLLPGKSVWFALCTS